MARPLFSTLEANYSTEGAHSCSMAFPNTCAIRMSEALVAASPELLETFRKSGRNVCPHGYVRGAQDLAAILESASAFGRHEYGWSRPGSAPRKITGKHG